jgi:FHS family L-fucose permease-like MFS transporter
VALFIIASGCAFLETAANPYVTILGKPETATTRLNFAQSFNGLGAFIAPMLGGKLILSGIENTEEEFAAMSSIDSGEDAVTSAITRSGMAEGAPARVPRVRDRILL